MAGARGKGMEARVCDNTCDTGEVERRQGSIRGVWQTGAGGWWVIYPQRFLKSSKICGYLVD